MHPPMSPYLNGLCIAFLSKEQPPQPQRHALWIVSTFSHSFMITHWCMLDNDVCPICYDALVSQHEQPVHLAPCMHTFHRACIEQWILGYKTTCPYWYALVDQKDEHAHSLIRLLYICSCQPTSLSRIQAIDCTMH